MNFFAAPPEPSFQAFPTEVTRTANTIRVRFRENYFSNENGNVMAYSVIVAEDDSKSSKGLEMLGWKDVQDYSVWPPYQVMNCTVFVMLNLLETESVLLNGYN